MKKRIIKLCPTCKKEFSVIPSLNYRKSCSKKCFGVQVSLRLKNNHPFKGKHHTELSKEKNRLAHLDKVAWNKGLTGYMAGSKHHWFGRNVSGSNSPSWKGGMKFWKKEDRRSDGAYQYWRAEVYKRDNFKCRILNTDCGGRIEAHHILGWKSYPELRYELNNGITLCHAHHPKKRAEEKRLIPIFRELVSVSNNQF